MNITIMTITAAVLAAFLCAVPSRAQVLCASHKQVIDTLKGKYRERMIATGGPVATAKPDHMTITEVYAAPDGKTFTVIVVTPDGLACIVAAGSKLMTFSTPTEGDDT